MGRPTKLTPQTQERIITAMLAGNYFHVSCEANGVDKRTGHNWLARGRDAQAQAEEHDTPIPRSEEIYVHFLHAVTQARAQAEVSLVGLVTDAAELDWRAAVEILKRGFRENWRDDIVVSHTGTVRVEADESLAHLEEVARLMLDAGE